MADELRVGPAGELETHRIVREFYEAIGATVHPDDPMRATLQVTVTPETMRRVTADEGGFLDYLDRALADG